MRAVVKTAPSLFRGLSLRESRRTDREFLPAALEILETPPSPVRMSLLVLICAFCVVALAWSYFSRIDIIAVAQGKLQPTGHVKVIQPLETSRVLSLEVENGTRVHAGDVLVRLDPADFAADAAETRAELASALAEALRRRTSILAAASRALDPPPALAWPASIPPAIRHREQEVYAADILQLRAQVASLDAQAVQKVAEEQRLDTMIAAQTTLIATLQQRVAMSTELMAMNAGSKAKLIDAEEAVQVQQTSLAQQRGQLAEAKASMSVFGKDIQRAYDTFGAENAQKLAEAERQAGGLVERLGKVDARLRHMELRSPIDGYVQASVITTVGQIVTSGEEVMRIVPDREALEIESYLLNRDIGFVKVGDRAIIKIESFPFTRYGTIDAVVTSVARDAIPEADAESEQRDPIHSAQSLSQGGGQRTQNLVFPVSLRPLKTSIDVDGTQVPLGAGMAVTAEIRTGSRRILEYVFSPLVKVGSEAFKER